MMVHFKMNPGSFSVSAVNGQSYKSKTQVEIKRNVSLEKFPEEFQTLRQSGSDRDVLHSSPSARCVPPTDSFTFASIRYAEKLDRLPTVWHAQHPVRQASIT